MVLVQLSVLSFCTFLSGCFRKLQNHTPVSRLCLKTVIQERGTEWGECYIPGNVAKHFGECPQTIRGMSSNISGMSSKHAGECRKTFWGMSPNIPGNVVKHAGECRQTFWGMSPNILRNVLRYSGECPSVALLLYASSVTTSKIHLRPRGIATTITMLQTINWLHKNINLNFSWPYTRFGSMLSLPTH